jgi:hypothetical protein
VTDHTRLKGGYTATDNRLGRVPDWDERNHEYLVREVLPAGADVATRTWRLAALNKLDQTPRNRTEPPGTCVGHGWAHRRNSAPHTDTLTHDDALAIFNRAQTLDSWPGAWPEYDGTSVLAGAKAMRELKMIGAFRWALTLTDILLAVSYEGPVVMGTWWTEDMFNPNSSGYVKPTGADAGGHCWIVRGVNTRNRYVTCTNSWGLDWGVNGDFRLTWEDLSALLDRDGEACVPTET